MIKSEKMWDNLYKSMCKYDNLELAWTRIKTSQNIDYKNYYRQLLLAYELSKKQNLQNLSTRLNGGSYKPSRILRFYTPKVTGLHRPITFLHLEDLIVYQAIVNVVADKFRKERKKIELQNVFSHLLTDKKNIFFFKKWQEGYFQYKSRIHTLYDSGLRWVAHFDIASFYDTLDHSQICKRISPKNAYPDFTDLLTYCLKTWSTRKSDKLNHGIPQGPISSGLLAEIFLINVDKKLMSKGINYMRYVDDIRIMGKSREEVFQGIMILESETRDIGLIPQGKKFAITLAQTPEDALGSFPSLTSGDKEVLHSNKKEAYDIFMNAFDIEGLRKSSIKYILKSSPPNKLILSEVLKIIADYPEFVDDFHSFLMNYVDDSTVAKLIYTHIRNNKFLDKYVEGKYWDLLSNFTIDDAIIKKDMLDNAMIRLKENKNEYSLKLGLYNFICSTDNKLIIKWINNEDSSLIQSFVVPKLPMVALEDESLIEKFLNRSNFEPALSVLSLLNFYIKSEILEKLTPPTNDDTGVIANALGATSNIDPINILLKELYSTLSFNKWDVLLSDEYGYANKILFIAVKSYHIESSEWVNYTDSFNDLVTVKLLELLRNEIPDVKWTKTVDRNGQKVDFGVLLDGRNNLSKKYPKLVDGFKTLHNRRSSNPASHPYDKKSFQRSTFVTSQDKRKLLGKLIISYENLITILSTYIT